MTTRTTKQDLEKRIDHLRTLTGRKFYLTGAYGGWQLAEDINGGGQIVTPGFVSKRELEDRLNSIITGFYMGERSHREQMAREQERIYGSP
jgi:hypothetical protein